MRPRASRSATCRTKSFLADGDPAFVWQLPADEWNAIALNYTSGTTGNPKGVVTHHRGAYLNAVSNVVTWEMPRHPVYLWTLPMFHCNGWCFPWTLALQAGASVCLRKVDTAADLQADPRAPGDPPVRRADRLRHADQRAASAARRASRTPINGLIAGSAPPAAIIEGCERIGIAITHVYGLTESYGPGGGVRPAGRMGGAADGRTRDA